MEFLYEKVAYLKGLSDGLDIEESTKEGKLLISIIDVLEDFANAIVELDKTQMKLLNMLKPWMKT